MSSTELQMEVDGDDEQSSVLIKKVDEILELDARIRMMLCNCRPLINKYEEAAAQHPGLLLQSGSTVEGCALARCLKGPVPSMELELDLMYCIAMFDAETTQTAIIPIADKPGHVKVRYDSLTRRHFEQVKVRDRFNITKCGSEDCFLDPEMVKMESADFFKFSDDEHITKFLIYWLYGYKPGDLTVSHKAEITGASAAVDICVSVGPELLLECSMDHVPCIKVQSWPQVAAAWIHRERAWPTDHVIRAITDKGCHVVPKPAPGDDDKKLWRLSFSNPEMLLTAIQSRNQRRAYFLLKCLFYRYIKNAEPEKLTSYFVKTIMLWTCEQKPPDDVIWRDENIVGCVTYLLREVQSCFRAGVIRHYFIPQVNLLQEVPAQALECALVRIDVAIDKQLVFQLNLDRLQEIVNELMSDKLNQLINGWLFVKKNKLDELAQSLYKQWKKKNKHL